MERMATGFRQCQGFWPRDRFSPFSPSMAPVRIGQRHPELHLPLPPLALCGVSRAPQVGPARLPLTLLTARHCLLARRDPGRGPDSLSEPSRPEPRRGSDREPSRAELSRVQSRAGPVPVAAWSGDKGAAIPYS